jgi:hypothetical protein
MAETKSKGSQIGSAALGAAGTAIAPGLGTAIGSALGGLLGGAIGGGKGPARNLNDASPEIKKWFADTGAGAFASYLMQNKPEAFSMTIDEILPLFYAWLLSTRKSVAWWTRDGNPRNPIAYRPGLTESAWAALGVDFDKSVLAYQSTPSDQRTFENVYVMLPGGGTPTLPTVGLDALQNIKDKADRGAPLSQAERNALDAMNKSAGASLELGSLPVIIIILVVAYFIFKR